MKVLTILKALSDENRLRILNIVKEFPLCVGEIQTILTINQSNASRHLDKLKNSELIVYNKDAQWIYYQLNEELLEVYPFIKQLLFEDLKRDANYQEDLKRLKQYKMSGLCCQNLKEIGFDFKKI